MSDQDDCWHPDKLETLLGALGDAQLVYSDARIVDAGRRAARRHVLEPAPQQPHRPALAARRQLGHRRGLAVPARAARPRAAVPAPPVHALPRPLARARRAASLGEIAFVDRPLYDYVQHGERGARPRGRQRMPTLRDRLREAARGPARPRAALAAALLRRLLPAHPVHDRPGDALRRPDERRQAPRAAQLPARRALARRARRASRAARGPRARRRAARRSAPRWRSSSRSRGGGCWSRPPAGSSARGGGCGSTPGRRRRSSQARAATAPEQRRRSAPSRRRSRRSSWPSARTRRARVNILIPTIDLEHFFGGYIAKLNLARRLAERGARVRIVTVDPVGVAAVGLAAHARVATAGSTASSTAWRWSFGRESQGIEVSRAGPLRRDHLVDRPHRRDAPSRALGRRALPLPDPGVRAVHVPDGELRGAGRASPTRFRTARCSRPSCCATTSARTAWRLRRGRDGGRRASAVFENAITAIDAASRRRPGAARAAAAALLRAARAARRPQHVRARRAGLEPRGRERRLRRGLGAARHRHRRGAAPRSRARRRRDARAAPAPRAGRLRGRCCASTTSAWR